MRIEPVRERERKRQAVSEIKRMTERKKARRSRKRKKMRVK